MNSFIFKFFLFEDFAWKILHGHVKTRPSGLNAPVTLSTSTLSAVFALPPSLRCFPLLISTTPLLTTLGNHNCSLCHCHYYSLLRLCLLHSATGIAPSVTLCCPPSTIFPCQPSTSPSIPPLSVPFVTATLCPCSSQHTLHA